MQTLPIFLLIAVAVMSCSGELPGQPKEPQGHLKRGFSCPPKAICQPATHPPPITKERRFADQAEDEVVVDDKILSDPIIQRFSGSRQKRGSKPVPITYCNRKTGKCTRF
ncbi:uncharacterized protein [Halyomorpha halys]|uniref:uncharacterized protein n=1 Tax=Halyomorpha halys TaxID=286706 RepID=UPI0006D4F2C0|nr:uncharacterized protein LOC106692263 [Halyomorpha halys]